MDHMFEALTMFEFVPLEEATTNAGTISRGSVLNRRGAATHFGELNHALSQEGGPTQSLQSRSVSSGHHISTEHRLRR